MGFQLDVIPFDPESCLELRQVLPVGRGAVVSMRATMQNPRLS